MTRPVARPGSSLVLKASSLAPLEELASSEEPWEVVMEATPVKDQTTAAAPEGQAQPVAQSPGVQEAVPALASAEGPP